MKEKQYQCPSGDGKGLCKINNLKPCNHAKPHKYLMCDTGCKGNKCEEVKDVF